MFHTPKKIILFSFILLSSLFLVSKVDAAVKHYCVYLKGAEISSQCVPVGNFKAKPKSCSSSSGLGKYLNNAVGEIYMPANFYGSYESTNSVYYSKGFCLKVDGFIGTSISYDDADPTVDQTIVYSSWAAIKDNNSDLNQKIVEYQLSNAPVKKCCVPTVGRAGSGPDGCHKPNPIKSAGFGSGNPENFFIKLNYDFSADTVIGSDPSWAFYQCGTKKGFSFVGDGGLEDGWYYWNISCDEHAPLNMSLAELSFKKVKEYTGSPATLLASTYCKPMISDNYCACKKDKSDCSKIFLVGQLKCQDKVSGLGSDYECVKVPDGTECSSLVQEAVPPSPFPDLNVLNKLGDRTIPQIVGGLISKAMGILGAIALALFVYAGILWMTAMGNAESQKKAWDIMIWAVLGIVVILSSWAIVTFIFGAFE